MIKYFIFFIFIFNGCSFKTPPNEWQFKSVNAFDSYTKNFLRSNDLIAQNDLSRAVNHAKQTPNLTQLGKIYLGECALNLSVGIEDKCQKYSEISSLINSNELKSYFNFLTNSLNEKDIESLPHNYKKFAEYYIKNDFINSKKEMFEIDKISSKLIAASKIKDQLTYEEIDLILNDISFYGYKKSAVFWLNVQKSKTTNKKDINNIDKKINILNS